MYHSKLDLNELKNLAVEAIKPKNLIFLTFGASSSVLLYYTLNMYLKRRKYRHIPGPPTKGIKGFFKGNYDEMVEASKNDRVFVELMADWQKKYGDVFKYQMFNEMFIFTADRDTVREVLIDKVFHKSKGQQRRLGFPMGERLLGFGLLTDPDQVRWKHRRAMYNPGFHRQVLMTFIEHFNQITNVLTDKLRSMADGKTLVMMFNEINRATLDAIALIAFGMNTDAVTQQESVINSYLNKVLHTAMDNAFDPLMRYRPLKHRQVNEYKMMARYLRNIGKEKIMERIKAFQNNEYIPNDILSTILKEFKGEQLDLEEMADDFLTFFVAGQETTANALSFCFLEMGKNPEIVKKAREEVDRVLGEREEVTYQDVNDLKYCSAIFKEALRLYPPASFVNRVSSDKLTIQGYEIPQNTQIFMSTFVTSRDERYFKDPLVFNPERFVKDSGVDKFENYVYYPFGLGPRNCIGQNFAHLEGVTVIAKLIQKFDIRLDPTQSMALELAITLRPKDGTRCYLTLRS